MSIRENDREDTGQSRQVHREQRSPGAAMDRRQFLKWMGLVGVVAAVGAGAGLRVMGNALAGVASEQQASAPAGAADVAEVPATSTAVAQSSAAATPQPTATPVATTQSTTSSTCVVRCPNGCSYPGRCKRYTDSNGNGRCDWGECM